MSELALAVRRTLYQREQLRRALLDTSVLTTDIIAATKRPDPSSFVAGARARTVRCLIPAHVWDEVPRVLADRHREGGRFDLGRALELWQSRYAPVLYVVDTTNLPMTPQGEVLADRDASDVPMLLLADVIAPVVLIGTDKDLVASGLADADWAVLRKLTRADIEPLQVPVRWLHTLAAADLDDLGSGNQTIRRLHEVVVTHD